MEVVVDQIGESTDPEEIKKSVKDICVPGRKMDRQPFLPTWNMYEACMAFMQNWEEDLVEWLPRRRDYELDEVAMVFCGKPGSDGGNPGMSEACRGVDVRNVIQRKRMEQRATV